VNCTPAVTAMTSALTLLAVNTAAAPQKGKDKKLLLARKHAYFAQLTATELFLIRYIMLTPRHIISEIRIG
jgi:hypothetical protein